MRGKIREVRKRNEKVKEGDGGKGQGGANFELAVRA